MSENFRLAYAELTDFIRNHTEIEIGESVTSIPANVRADFYPRFNAARNAFVEEKFPQHLSRALKLQEEYDKAIEETAGLLAPEDTPEISRLRRFLRDPKESLSRELFDPLFDLLKKRNTLDDFEKEASARISEFFPGVYRGGYEKWVILSLANLSEAETVLRVPVRELQPGARAKSAACAPIEEVPSPVESSSFFPSQPSKAIFAAPDFIVRSARLNRFMGIRSEFKEGIYNALNVSHERDWLPVDVDLLRLLANGLTLIYIAETPESISLTADVSKFCKPDLVLWCVDAQTISRKEALEKMALADSHLKPSKGAIIVANDLWPETGDAAESPDPNGRINGDSPRIQVLTACFDSMKLIPVIEALNSAEGPAATT